MRITLLESPGQIEGLASAWDRLLRQDANSAHGAGFTGSLDWTRSLWEVHLQSRPQTVLVLEDKGEVVGILACHQRINSGPGVAERVIEPITEICAGRTGLLVKQGAPHYLRALLDYLFTNVAGWDTFRCTLVDGSESARLFSGVVSESHHAVRGADQRTSPYIVLPPQLNDFVAGLPRNFRDNLKKSERRLRKSGDLQIRHYRAPGEVPDFLVAMLSIEQRSWKEQAGTSITSNPLQEGLYRHFLKRAAERNWLMGTVLSVNGNPIAYAMGFIFENVYYNEKASYDESMRETGAGSYIYLPIIEELMRRGVTLFDFMGECEEYKMRWTSDTYSRTTWIVYNTGMRSRLLQSKHLVGSALKRIAGSAHV